MYETSDKRNQLINELQQLNKQREEIINKERICEKRILLLKEESNNDFSNTYREYRERKELDKIYKQENTISKKISDIKEEIFWLTPPIKINEFIEIRKEFDDLPKNNVIGRYFICITSKRKIVGEIYYRGYHVCETFGDVGYRIDMDFRGNNYSYYALCLLGELLKENGIDDFWISTYKNNIPSIKTIEKYGGVLINSERSIYLYKAKTFINNKKNIIK